jgi:RNA 3'-terminal phosphate cyclase
VVGIRAGRKVAGLAAQHLAGLHLVNRIASYRYEHSNGYQRFIFITLILHCPNSEQQVGDESITSESGRLVGAYRGSIDIQLLPPPPSFISSSGGVIAPFPTPTLVVDPGTAGSISLLLQSAMPCLLFFPSMHQRERQGKDSVVSLLLRGGDLNRVAFTFFDKL